MTFKHTEGGQRTGRDNPNNQLVVRSTRQGQKLSESKGEGG